MSIKEEVMSWLDGYEDEDKEEALTDLSNNGCASAMVSGLIYYVDTLAFFERNKEEINKKLHEVIEECGEHVLPNFKGYDVEDPLCLETTNQNMLAWWAFEGAAFEVYRDLYEKG